MGLYLNMFIRCYNLIRSYSTVQVRCPNEFKPLSNFGHFHGYFGYVQPYMFVSVICRSSSIVHVRQCDYFLVILIRSK